MSRRNDDRGSVDVYYSSVPRVSVSPPSRGPDPIRDASTPSGGVYYRRVEYVTQLPVPGASSLSTPVAGGASSADPDPRNGGSQPSDPPKKRRYIKGSSLKIDVPKNGSIASSNSAAKTRDPMTCKARPETSKPKGGGGGKGRFIPWCK